MKLTFRRTALLGITILVVMCILSCNSSDNRNASKKIAPHPDAALIAAQKAAEAARLSSLADSAIQSLKQHQTPLFNSTSVSIEWPTGPVIQTQYGHLFDPLMSEIGRRMDSLNKAIPKWDDFLTIKENQKKYDDIVLRWEHDMLLLLGSIEYAQLHIIDAKEIPLYFSNSLEGRRFDFTKAAERHFAKKSLQEAQCREIWLGRCSGYTADVRLLCLQLSDVSISTHNSGPFPTEIGQLSIFGNNCVDLPRVPPDEARALYARDSTSIILEVCWDKPVILYHRRHSVYWNNHDYYRTNSIDWTIDVWVLTHVSSMRVFGYNVTNGGTIDSLVHIVNVDYTKLESSLRQGLRFSSDQQEATPD